MSRESREIAKAIERGDALEVRSLCASHAAQLRTSGELQTLFEYAASSNRPWAMEILLQSGGDIHAPIDETSKLGLLYSAAACGATDSVRWLIEHGATVNQMIEGELRSLSLFTAIRQGHLDIVKLLVSHGAVLQTVWNGQTPAECALAYHRADVATYLRSVSTPS